MSAGAVPPDPEIASGLEVGDATLRDADGSRATLDTPRQEADWVLGPFTITNTSLSRQKSRHAESTGELLYIDGSGGSDVAFMCLHSTHTDSYKLIALLSYDDTPVVDKFDKYFGDTMWKYVRMDGDARFGDAKRGIGTVRVTHEDALLLPDSDAFARRAYNAIGLGQPVSLDMPGTSRDVTLDVPSVNEDYMEFGGRCDVGRNRVRAGG